MKRIFLSLLSFVLLWPLTAGAATLRQIHVEWEHGNGSTTSTGAWQNSVGASPYGSTSLYTKEAGATYTFDNEAIGTYEVSLWWTSWSDRNPNVPVEIYDGNTLLDTLYVNQQVSGGQWNALGTYSFGSTARVVIHNPDATFTANADAVRLVPTGYAVSSEIIVDNGDQPADIAGYKLYYNGGVVCESYDPAARQLDCEVSIASYPATFTATAYDSAGNESAPSEPYVLTEQTASANTPPQALLQADILSGETPLTVNFDGTTSTDADGTIVAYAWDFGDGEIASGELASHTFMAAGTYTVTLTVTDDQGASGQTQTTVEVIDPSSTNLTPTASLSASLQTGQAPLAVSFDGLDSTDPDGTIAIYAWDFGDGETGQGEAIDHIYTAPGTYTATLTVTDNAGASAQAETVITVTENTSTAAGFAFNFQPADAAAPTGYVPDSGSAYNETTGFGWTQPAGPMGPRDRNNSLSMDETYDTMIHVDPAGIWELAVPNGDYVVTVCAGDPSYPDSLQYVYAEGMAVINGESLTPELPWIERQAAVTVADGRLTLSFEGSSPYGKLAWLRIDHANETPAAVIAASAFSGPAPLAVNFSGEHSTDSDGSIAKYSWDFGDGGSGTGAVIDHSFAAAGSYTVTLTVTDNQGAVGTTQSTIVVEPAPPATDGSTDPATGTPADPTTGTNDPAAPTGINAMINFQPKNSEIPTGFLADSGQAFDAALGYGWVSAPASLGTRDRNDGASPDQAYDTLIHVDPSGVWEMSVPNGTYTVTLAAGDPTWPDMLQNIQVEGVTIIDHQTLDAAHKWLENTVTVNVTDGALTLTCSGSDRYAKINWLKIVGDSSQAQAPAPIDSMINFQPKNSEVPAGYLADSGQSFDAALGYGWVNGPGSIGTRDRNDSASPDQAYDTLIHVDSSAVWEMAVPSGTYTVTFCVGDPSYPDSLQNVQIEGVPVLSSSLNSSTPWIEKTVTIDVTDGKLSLAFAGSDRYAKLNWVKITR